MTIYNLVSKRTHLQIGSTRLYITKFNCLIPKTLIPNDPLDHQTHNMGFQKHYGLAYVARYGFIRFGQHHDVSGTFALFMSILAMIIVMIIVMIIAISKTISCQGAACFAPLRTSLGQLICESLFVIVVDCNFFLWICLSKLLKYVEILFGRFPLPSLLWLYNDQSWSQNISIITFNGCILSFVEVIRCNALRTSCWYGMIV